MPEQTVTKTATTQPADGSKLCEVTGTDVGSTKRALDVNIASGGSNVTGLTMADGDEISIALGNLTYTITSNIGDQVEDDSTPIPNFASKSGGVAVLDYLKIQNSIGGATGKLDLDILISESALTTSSGDGTPFGVDADNHHKIRHTIEVRENHWLADPGSLDSSAYVPIDDLLQKIKCVGSSSAHFTIVWRGVDLAVGSSETLLFWFGTTYLDAP